MGLYKAFFLYYYYLNTLYFDFLFFLIFNFFFYLSDLKKAFEVPPYPQNVEMDQSAEIPCRPPTGVPQPKVYWLKNGVPLESDSNIIVSSDGHLLVGQARLQDTANYTCVAENIAAKRIAEPALLTVYGKLLIFFFLLLIYVWFSFTLLLVS